MIIQKVIKGISGIDDSKVNKIFQIGITCRWWSEVGQLPQSEIPQRLTDRNLRWHQNRYYEPDPREGNQPFYLRTPFISTTAGTVERDSFLRKHNFYSAKDVALNFATDFINRDGYLFYCYVFVIGKKSVGHRMFAEEIRELNIHTEFSSYQIEGEITAKIIIPTTQIQKAEYWQTNRILDDLSRGVVPSPTNTIGNPLYLPPEDYSNVRELL